MPWMEAARSYLKSIVSSSAVRDTPILAEPPSVITPEDSVRDAAKEVTPRAHENEGVLKLLDEDEAEVQATDKYEAITSTFGAEAAMTSIPVIDLDRPESSIVMSRPRLRLGRSRNQMLLLIAARSQGLRMRVAKLPS
jgi:hypothetical protein